MTSSSLHSAIGVVTGPAGRAMAQPMDPALVDALHQHLNLERRASAAYFAMAIWFAERELRGFAHHCQQEASSEQAHAGRFADYLLARGQTVILEDVPAPRQSWASTEEIVASAFQMEADVSSSLHQLYGMAERSADVRTTSFLDPLVDGQVAAEHGLAHLLGRLRLAQGQPAALLILDAELANGQHSPASLA